MNKRFVLFVLFFLGSCQKQKVCKEEIKASSSVEELEARFFDVPFPMDVTSSNVIENTITLSVKAALSDLILFYKANFEMLGWDQTEEFGDSIFVFRKPNKKLCLIIKQNKEVVEINIVLK